MCIGEYGPSQLQIDSYNQFVDKLPKLIKEQGQITTVIEHDFELGTGDPQELTWDF